MAEQHLPTAQDCAAVFERLRIGGTRVHCITSEVAAERTANTLLAIGCTPSLTYHPDEVADFVRGSDALLINLGMMTPTRELAIERAIDAAGGAARPWVLDPVFVNASRQRASLARTCHAARPTIVKLNGAESDGLLAPSADEVRVVTGAADVIGSPAGMVAVANGHVAATRVTAIGCALGAVMAGCLAVEKDASLAATAACVVYGIAIEQAAEVTGASPGSFGVVLLDMLAGLTADTIVKRAKIT